MDAGTEISLATFGGPRPFALPLLRTAPHPCSYLPQRTAREQIALTGAEMSPERYQALMDAGFRRSGHLFYRTDCPACRACVPIRVPVRDFRPSRSQRRNLHRNADVEVHLHAPADDDERFELFSRYQAWRHADRASDRRSFADFLVRSPIDTLEMSYRIGGRLVGVGIVDLCPISLSSVYFYCDPDHHGRSLGTFSALCEIEECRRRELPYWYIGFYVAQCAKMTYKASFRPHELLRAEGVWGA